MDGSENEVNKINIFISNTYTFINVINRLDTTSRNINAVYIASITLNNIININGRIRLVNLMQSDMSVLLDRLYELRYALWNIIDDATIRRHVEANPALKHFLKEETQKLVGEFDFLVGTEQVFLNSESSSSAGGGRRQRQRRRQGNTRT